MHKGAEQRVTQATPRATCRMVGAKEDAPEGEPVETWLEWGVTETRPKLEQKIIRTRHAEIFAFPSTCCCA